MVAQRLAPHAKYEKDRFRLPLDMFEFQDSGRTAQELGQKRTLEEADGSEGVPPHPEPPHPHSPPLFH